MENINPFTANIRIGKKGQVTLPKKLRETEELHEADILIVTRTANGELLMKKQRHRDGLDTMLDAIQRAPQFDFKKAWQEVLEERRKDV